MSKFNLNNLFVLDLANNHQGNLQHGLDIIDKLAEIIKKEKIKAAIKFQFRQLETFIHPKFKKNKGVKHIDRFESTKLTLSDYKKMIARIKEHKILTMCTPFDEESLDVIKNLDIDILKIASCSCIDIPLINKISKMNYPIIASTGGANDSEIDYLVTMLEKAGAEFALNHCIAIYPTPKEKLQLNQIEYLKKRYFGISVGWSTHEEPDDLKTVQLAYAKGATIFERHVGLETKDYKLNKYSSSPNQIEKWIQSYKVAVNSCGSEKRSPASQEEIDSINSLLRGVYAKKNIIKGDKINLGNAYFAMPCQKNFMTVRDWKTDLIAEQNYKVNDPIKKMEHKTVSNDNLISDILIQVKGMLREARILLKPDQKFEISHHYGLSRFREFGAVIINLINREYCKKLIVQLPRQKHPYHHHKKKKETFHILHGDLEIEKNGNPSLLKEGDIYYIERNQWHKFSTLHGVIFEEISTTHYSDDSFYQDQKINDMSKSARKTVVSI